MKFKPSNAVSTELPHLFGETDEEKADRQAEWQDHLLGLSSVANVYTKADRILVGDEVTCHVVSNEEYTEQMPTGAWSDGKNIYFNSKLIDNVDEASLVSLNGLNYHEVAHILFSPRSSSEIVLWAKEKQYTKALNILEEARIENLLTTKYPSTRPYLEATTLQYLLDRPKDEWADSHPIMVGRKYVELEWREKVGQMFVAKYGLQTAIEITDIVNKYRNLVLPESNHIAMPLIERLGQFISGNMEMPQQTCADRKQMDKGRPSGKREQTKLQDKSKNGVQEADPELSENEPYQNKEQLDSPNTTNSDVEKEALKKQIEKLINSKEVKQDIKNTKQAISKASHRNGLTRLGSIYNMTPTTEMRGIAKRFADELERLRVEADPSWEKETPSGRLNIGRAMKKDINNIGKVFDRWEFNEDNSDIEAVILLDRSGSMYNMNQVCSSAWAIKRAIERINGKVAIYSFNHHTRTLYKSSEKANPMVIKSTQSSGGTAPFEGLMEAQRTFMGSTAPTKLLFVLTDGEWSADTECDNIITQLNQDEVITCVVYLGNIDKLYTYEQWVANKKQYLEMREISEAEQQELLSLQEYNEYKSYNDINRYRHNAKYFRVITKPTDLVQVAKDLTTSKLMVAR